MKYYLIVFGNLQVYLDHRSDAFKLQHSEKLDLSTFRDF